MSGALIRCVRCSHTPCPVLSYSMSYAKSDTRIRHVRHVSQHQTWPSDTERGETDLGLAGTCRCSKGRDDLHKFKWAVAAEAESAFRTMAFREHAQF
eukprot:3005212-Rhodomonas_salina.2